MCPPFFIGGGSLRAHTLVRPYDAVYSCVKSVQFREKRRDDPIPPFYREHIRKQMQNKRTARLGQSFLQQRQLSICEIYNFQSALLSHMHGLRGTA